jgi:hypothetical protein
VEPEKDGRTVTDWSVACKDGSLVRTEGKTEGVMELKRAVAGVEERAYYCYTTTIGNIR